jgi:hypothetical protein
MALQGVGKGSDWYNLSYFTGPARILAVPSPGRGPLLAGPYLAA